MNRQHLEVIGPALRQTALSAALLAALAACGSGAGLVRPPPATLPPPIVRPPGSGNDQPPVVQPPNPEYMAHLRLTNAERAHDAGLDGAGVRVGVVDSGVNRAQPSLRNRVVANLNYVDPNRNDLSKDDVAGHGTAVAQVIAGTAFGTWPGGIAPAAEIVSARIINDEPPEDDGSGDGNQVDGALGLEPIHDDLIARGVKVMNNSWGGLYWSDLRATNEIAQEYRKFVHNNNGLVVFATGNEGKPEPSDMAALPSQPGPDGSRPAADLTRGWLAVTAVDPNDLQRLDVDNDGNVYANACGAAMHYCLAAPGTVTTTGIDDKPASPSYWRWKGTSLAAPQVSGAAALVWQKYPYFSNDLVRQTLLGTARDLGVAGPDSTFGYGLLDVGKAIRGPARFDWGDVVVSFDGGVSTWGNTIGGGGGLVKRGSGELVLDAGANAAYDYTGATRVSGGSLRLAGNASFASPFVVDAGATLAGSARVPSLFNDGTLRLDEAAFTVTGDYTQTPNAHLAVVLESPLHVDGAATLAGDLHVLGVKREYVNRSSFNIVTAGQIRGAFDSLSSAANVFLQGQLAYDQNRVTLNVARLEVTRAAQALGVSRPAALNSAQRLETAFARIDAELDDVPAAAGRPKVSGQFKAAAGKFQHIADADVARAALSSLSGEVHVRAASATLDSIDMHRRGLSERFEQLDGGVAPTVGSWSRSLGSGTHPSGYVGSDLSIDGWMLGHDRRLDGNVIAGFAFGVTRSNARVAANQDRSRDRQNDAQLYLGGIHGNGYTLARLGFGRFDRDIDRRLFTGDGWTRAQSAYSGGHVSLSLEAGRHFLWGGARITPYLGVEHTRLHSDGFDESNAGAFGLTGRGWQAERSQAIVGVRMRRAWRDWSLHGHAEWQQTLGANGFGLQASFVGLDAWSPLPSLAPGRSGGSFGIGAQTWLSARTQLSFGVDQRFGPRGDDRMASMQLRAGF